MTIYSITWTTRLGFGFIITNLLLLQLSNIGCFYLLQAGIWSICARNRGSLFVAWGLTVSFSRSASPEITGLTLRRENADNDGEYFFRLEQRTGDDPETKCRKWSDWQEKYLKANISNADNFIPACPCSIFQVIFSPTYYLIFFTEPDSVCFVSIFVFPFNNKEAGSNSSVQGFILRKCCYSNFFFGALLTGSDDPGSLEVFYTDKPEDLLDDAEAKQACCFDSFNCDLYDNVRPSDDCERFFIPRRRKSLVSLTGKDILCIFNQTIRLWEYRKRPSTQ